MNTNHNFSLRHRHSGAGPAAAERAGFTLTELLVVIGVIGVLSVMLLPALASPKSDGRAFRCLNNTRQLTLASIMYASDNNEFLLSPLFWVNAGGSYNFEDWSMNPGNTNSALMLEPGPNNNSALIAPYDRNPSTFKCPSDIFDGPAGPRVRSYSLNGALGGSPLFGTAYQPNGEQRIYFSAIKTTDLNAPGPANIFTFLDEHPDSINDGAFMLNAGHYAPVSEHWRDYPGSLHGGAVSISFADGHSVIHQWMDSRT